MQTLMPNQMIHPERNDQRSKDPSEDYTAEASPFALIGLQTQQVKTSQEMETAFIAPHFSILVDIF